MLRVLALVASLAAALAFTSAASADKPVREPAPSADVTGSFCADFDVLVHVTGDKGKAITFSSGRTTISGQLKVELTNLETDKTVARNISGPVFISADGSTVTLSGRSMLFGEAGEFGPDPILWITSGPDIVTLDSEGNITGLTTSGHVIDMCEVLA
jgi:ribosomal protein S28E/S33